MAAGVAAQEQKKNLRGERKRGGKRENARAEHGGAAVRALGAAADDVMYGVFNTSLQGQGLQKAALKIMSSLWMNYVSTYTLCHDRTPGTLLFPLSLLFYALYSHVLSHALARTSLYCSPSHVIVPSAHCFPMYLASFDRVTAD